MDLDTEDINTPNSSPNLSVSKINSENIRNSDLHLSEGGSESESGNEMIPEPSLDLIDRVSAEQDHVGFPSTYLCLRLAPNVEPATVTWLAQKITGKKQDGGAELLIRCEPFRGPKRDGVVFHITASKLKFLEVAEFLELKKTDSHGVLREFAVCDLDSFLYKDIHLDTILTPAEKQMIVLHELENIRALSGETGVPGHQSVTLYTGQSILEVYLQQELISAIYPLHDATELTKLGVKWYRALFEAQPLEDIRKYFGDAIALYFSFLGFYTTSLLAPAILGLFQFFLPESASSHSLVFFCIFNVIWVTVSLEMWKRKCSELAYSWGTLRMTRWEEPRPNFRGVMAIDPVTGRMQPKYPWWKTSAKAYCVSFPIVFVCLLMAFWIMLYSFWVEETLIESKQRYGSRLAGFLVMLPSIVYAGLVWLMNFYYRKLASHLTEWENHRTQAQFERHRVTKLVLFEFVNNFMSLFYIAFYIQDFEMLKSQVTVMLIIMQFINHFQEALLPLFIHRGYGLIKDYLTEKYPSTRRIFGEVSGTDGTSRQAENNNHTETDSIWSPSALHLVALDSTDARIVNSKKEIDMDPYEGTFDDYLEMFVQFGYVFLFSAVYPLAAVWAVVNNLLEIRADAFKLCEVFQRPTAKRVKDIGAWQIAFELMGGIAVMTNCALLSLSPNLRAYAPNMSPAEWLLSFVIIEHVLLAILVGLRQMIPDVPSNVKIALARLEYQSKQALKNEQAFKSRRQLTRRFKTVHVTNKKKGSSVNSFVSMNSDSPSTVLIQRKSKAALSVNTDQPN